MDCIFCKIVKGEIPSYKIYEDDLVYVFLDINPIAEGHALVIPKKHYENIYDTPEKVLERINVIAKKMALLFQEKLGVNAVNVLNASGKEAQQSVFHLHYHIVPRFDDDGLDLWFHGTPKSGIDVGKVKESLLNE